MYSFTDHPTPFLLVNLQQIHKQCQLLKSLLPDMRLYYAMKANSELEIVKAIASEGFGVEISSLWELQTALNLGISSDNIICSNPIKGIELLKYLHKYGCYEMAFDSPYEIDKIAYYAPNSRVYLRIKVNNDDSGWPLLNKFGSDVNEASELLIYAHNKGLVPFGLTFHVGSQCVNPGSWVSALEICARIVNKVSNQLSIQTINLGGGLPIKSTKTIPELSEFTGTINEAKKTLFGNQLEFTMEPGRAIVGESAVLVTSVIGKAARNNEDWLYLDVGVFNGLIETIGNITYEIGVQNKSRPTKVFTIAGPSCDSIDVLFTSAEIPEPLVGEHVYILNAGAYTISYASHFNGFPPPEVLYTNRCLT